MDLPENGDANAGANSGANSGAKPDARLSDHVLGLIDDGKTYAEAEIAFQKSRMSFAGNHGKKGVLYGVCAFAVLHLALVSLALGSIIALGPLVTAWGAAALVSGTLILIGVILAVMAKNRFAKISDAFSKVDE